MSDHTCPRLGLPHQYWPQGNCHYCGELAPALAANYAKIDLVRRDRDRLHIECSGHIADIAAKDSEIAKLREALGKAADQLNLVHDDAFKQAGGHGLVTTDGREFSCFQLNRCDAAASAARGSLTGGA